jgi:hypothetical protein
VISYRNVGLLLFFAASLVVMTPLIMRIIRQPVDPASRVPLSKEILFLTAALVYILFYYFNTEMHERYSHPAFIFIVAYAFLTRDFTSLALFSVAYFLNLESTLVQVPISHGTLIFDYRFISALYALTIFYMVWRLYMFSKTKYA